MAISEGKVGGSKQAKKKFHSSPESSSRVGAPAKSAMVRLPLCRLKIMLRDCSDRREKIYEADRRDSSSP
jgi:hypothetical protein